jgi:hypothetical protein
MDVNTSRLLIVNRPAIHHIKKKALKKAFFLKKLLGNDTCFVPNFTLQDFAVMFGKIIKLLLYSANCRSYNSVLFYRTYCMCT